MEANNNSLTQKSTLILKEYGRNVQKLVEYVCKIEDREKRTSYAFTLVDLMAQINPAIRDAQENAQKLWDDLYIMSGFTLDVDSPFPMPDKSAIGKKPQRVPYNTSPVRFKHYGKNMELLVKEVLAIEDSEERRSATIYLGRLMKSFYGSWNKENVDDVVILDNIKDLSKGKLSLELDEIRQLNLFDPLTSGRSSSTQNFSNNNNRGGGRSNSGGNNRRQNNNRNQNNKRRRRN